MRLLLILILLTNTLCAQHILRDDYSVNDPCPDPKKNKIESRKIYTNTIDPEGKQLKYADTVYERYDRNGNLLVEKYFDERHPKDGYSVTHEYAYDEKGRIITARSSVNENNWRVTYTYSETGDSVVVHAMRSDSSSLPVFRLVRYSQTDTTEYGLAQDGDTIHYLYHSKFKYISIWWKRDEAHQKVMIDSTVEIRSPKKIFSTSRYLDRHGEYATSEDVYLLDKKGRVTVELGYLNNHVLRDSVHYTYNKKGECILTTAVIFPMREQTNDTTISRWQTKYLHDKSGKLVQTHETNSARPNLRFVSSYIYNERGLLTEIHRVDLDNGHIVDESREHWVYTYY